MEGSAALPILPHICTVRKMVSPHGLRRQVLLSINAHFIGKHGRRFCRFLPICQFCGIWTRVGKSARHGNGFDAWPQKKVEQQNNNHFLQGIMRFILPIRLDTAKSYCPLAILQHISTARFKVLTL